MKPIRAAAVALLAVWLLPPGASAQIPSPTGNLFGTALDTQGNTLIGVTVTLTGPGAAQHASTGRDGGFHFLSLSPGDYSVLLERGGLEAVRQDVTVALGNVVLSLTMPVAGVAESVTVDSAAPGLDNREIETGATFGERELLDIPTTRDPGAFLRQVPGVLIQDVNVGGGIRAGQSPFVGKGSRPGQNNYNLDGVGISVGGLSRFFFDFDSFDDIEVTTGGSDLSIATPGVTLNLVTKRGTNQFRSSARALYTGGSGWDYGVEAGGPIWRDRLWLWGAFAKNDFLASVRILPTGDTLPSQETLTHWNAKLNAELTRGNALTLSLTDLGREIAGIAGARFSPESSGDTLRPGRSYRVQDGQVLSTASFLSGYLSYVMATETTTPSGGLEEQAYEDERAIWRNSYQFRRLFDDQRQAGLNASTFFHTGDLGHELKFGFGYRDLRFGDLAIWPGDQLVGHAQFEFDEADVTRAKNPKSRVNVYDVFLGDTVRAGNLTVTAGVRFDYQQGKNLPSEVEANPVFPELLPAVEYGGDAGYPVTWSALQPRVGVTYSLSDRLTLLRASYSRFVAPLGSDTIFAANPFPEIATLTYPWDDANGNGRVEPEEIDLSSSPFRWTGVNPDDPGSSTQINQIAKGFEPSTTDEFIVGVERQFAPDLSASLAYTYRTIRNLAFDPLIGTTRESYRYFGNATGTVTGELPSSDGFTLDFDEPYYGLIACPDPCVGRELQNRPDANETYSGVEIQLIKAFSHGWMARVSFAYNDWQQHIGPGAIVNPNNETPGVNTSGPAVAGVINATWQFNVSGSVQLPLGVAAGLNFFGRQGFPILYSVGVQTNDEWFNYDFLQVGKVGDYRNPNVYQLDLQLSRAFQLGSRVTVIPQFACFNLLDSRTVLEREGIVGFYNAAFTPNFDPNEDFNVVYEQIRPRVYRGGVRLTF